MRHDLVSKTLEGWARLNPRQQERFLEAGVKAALRLGPKGFRHWLLRRVRTPPLAAPIDLAAYAISDGDMSAFLKTLTNDQHTHKGRKMGRYLDHFRDEGSAADPIADRTKAAAEPCWGLVDRRHKLGVEDGTGFCEQPCGDALILPQKGTTLALQLLRLWIDHWQKERDNKGRGNFWV